MLDPLVSGDAQVRVHQIGPLSGGEFTRRWMKRASRTVKATSRRTQGKFARSGWCDIQNLREVRRLVALRNDG